MPTQSLCRVAAAALAWAAAALCGGLAADEPATTRRPNVLFIVADDLNRMLGCYGDTLAKTPNLDRLAARGVTFERAYCTFPLCGPSRNSFLTGLHPNATGIFANTQIFRQSIPNHLSLPQAFRQAGYFAGRPGALRPPGGSAGTDESGRSRRSRCRRAARLPR